MIEGKKSALYSEIDGVADRLAMAFERKMKEGIPKVRLIEGIDDTSTHHHQACHKAIGGRDQDNKIAFIGRI
ncbi:hypothetical protein [Methanocella conradii]|uniref:hypothetical protein n=1 Tax=Methanocella conradii TaxID=1175444 RepID=UPI00157D8F15|nr:hypothetical protein [Methanocella conradii]